MGRRIWYGHYFRIHFLVDFGIFVTFRKLFLKAANLVIQAFDYFIFLS
jgi:hypothetical protein